LSPLASTPGSALLFLTTALLMGSAALVLVAATVAQSALQMKLHGWLRTLIVLELAALAFEGLALYGGDAASVALFRATTQGPFGWTFWGLVIAGGLVLPVVARSAGWCSARAMSWNAVAIIIGAAATRYLMFCAR
jgi:formate-dependent nitrite reductase membrane component NrfD